VLFEVSPDAIKRSAVIATRPDPEYMRVSGDRT